MRLSFLPDEEQEYTLWQHPWDDSVAYKVAIKTVLYHPKKVVNVITYKVIVSCTKGAELPVFYYHIEKQGLKVNHTSPKNVFDEMSIEVNTIFNTLQFQVGTGGKLNHCMNYEALETDGINKK